VLHLTFLEHVQSRFGDDEYVLPKGIDAPAASQCRKSFVAFGLIRDSYLYKLHDEPLSSISCPSSSSRRWNRRHGETSGLRTSGRRRQAAYRAAWIGRVPIRTVSNSRSAWASLLIGRRLRVAGLHL